MWWSREGSWIDWTEHYFAPEALLVVISHPLCSFGGIWNLLIVYPVNRSLLDKSANLKKKKEWKKKQNVIPNTFLTSQMNVGCKHRIHSKCFISWFDVLSIQLHLIVRPEASLSCVRACSSGPVGWGSSLTEWRRQVEGSSVGSQTQIQFGCRGSLIPPVLHGKVLSEKNKHSLLWHFVSKCRDTCIQSMLHSLCWTEHLVQSLASPCTAGFDVLLCSPH